MVPFPEPGEDWAGFRIDREIGRSSRGRTYAAFDPSVRRTRALKVLGAVPSDDPAGERFQRLPVAASELGHRNIVAVHGSSDVDGTAFVIMDLYPSGSVADELAVSVVRLGRVREVLAQVAAALDTAHAAGLPHGNVKPTNILCGDDGHVVVSDFGCTRFVDEAVSDKPMTGEVAAGLPFHEAPEVLIGERVIPASDVYSMTSVFFEMLTGRTPYSGNSAAELTAAHRGAPVPLVTALRPDLPPELDEFVARGMAKDPAQRPASGVEFVAELDGTIAAALEHRRSEARRRPAVSDPFERAPETAEATAESGDRSADEGPDTPTVPAVASTYGGSRRARREGTAWRLEDGTVDGALVGVYEDEPRRRWPAVVITVVLIAAAVVVGWLVYRAAQADDTTTAQQVMPSSGTDWFTM